MTSDEQFVVILLGAILMAQRATAVIDAAQGRPRGTAQNHQTVATCYGKETGDTPPVARYVDLLA